MNVKITLTEDRFRELIRDAYFDGFDDGHSYPEIETASITEWEDSVTFDHLNAALHRNRKGKPV